MATFSAAKRYGGRVSPVGNEIIFSPDSNFNASGLAVLFACFDGSFTGDIYVDDSNGNTWTRQSSYKHSSRNYYVVVLTTGQDGGRLTTSDSISVLTTGTFSSGCLLQLLDVTAGSGRFAVYASVGNTSGLSATPSITSSSIASGDAVIGHVYVDTSTAISAGDSDTTNGTWGSLVTQEHTLLGNLQFVSGYQIKNVTGDGAQTYDVTFTTSRYNIMTWVSLTSVHDPNLSVTTKNVVVAGKQVALRSGRRVSVGTASITVAAGSAGLTLNRYVIRPSADSVDGNWTTESGGTDLYAAIDESVASTSDYIQSPSNPVDEVCKIKLDIPSIGANIPTQPMVVAYQFGKSADGAPLNLTVRLLQGATEIAAWTESDITTSWVTRERTLTTMQFNSITDFTDLYLEFMGTLH